ncbi:hypothetical protein [Sphaerisporangium fuscum]|uniref:hypothetical protein n=1 Tax=Sphaerisporangium fuscum TaxID=2835868 RepID=UPI001BDD306F|nr:hypothetical protein [Sphaerisporangium fuscum]
MTAPTDASLLYEVTGVIEAPVERVAELLLAVRPGPIGPDNLWLLHGRHGGTLSGGPERFTVQLTGHAMTVEVGARSLAMQGGWWYRGEFHIQPHPDGTRLVHRVLNVAKEAHWAVAGANRFFIGYRANLVKRNGEMLATIGERLGCAARPE